MLRAKGGKGSQLSSLGRKIDLGGHFQRQKVKGEGISNNKSKNKEGGE